MPSTPVRAVSNGQPGRSLPSRPPPNCKNTSTLIRIVPSRLRLASAGGFCISVTPLSKFFYICWIFPHSLKTQTSHADSFLHGPEYPVLFIWSRQNPALPPTCLWSCSFLSSSVLIRQNLFPAAIESIIPLECGSDYIYCLSRLKSSTGPCGLIVSVGHQYYFKRVPPRHRLRSRPPWITPSGPPWISPSSLLCFPLQASTYARHGSLPCHSSFPWIYI